MTERKNVYHSNFFAMGTRMDVVLPLIDNEQGDLIFNKIKNETKRLEKKLSRFNTESTIYNINQNAYKAAVEIDDELYRIIQQSITYNQLTNGYFDITARPLLECKIKGDTLTEINRVKENLGFDNVILLPGSIFFKNNTIEFDLGGFGKGYALEKIFNILRESETESAFISFGESSVLAHGKHPFGDYWGVGIKNLFDNSNIYAFSIQNKSLSTSGITPSNQKKYDGHAHIINPKTGYGQTNTKTISVVSGSAIDGEVLSTALMVCEENEKQELIHNFSVDEAIEISYNSDNSFKIKSLLDKNS